MVLPMMGAGVSDMWSRLKHFLTMDKYTYTESKLQQISEDLGRNFRAVYCNPAFDSDQVDKALEAYKATRRLMPTKPDGKRLGHLEAHTTTQ